MSDRTCNAIVCLYAQDQGIDPRRCDAAHAAQAWAVVGRIMGRTSRAAEAAAHAMVRAHLATCIPPYDIEPTFDALEVEADRIATPAFVARVRALASQVH